MSPTQALHVQGPDDSKITDCSFAGSAHVISGSQALAVNIF